ncbi:50S ribosomal protein L24 [uncultured Oscillibacter sp.]|uniref:50S ribosomal protein L24 n=1 Tax=uncultured Oscillibacter sp. TaxID=876091 RepID=UPI0025D9C68C|nr:50S ribosomal protein L24 [uncultured Oscillibacter sp.]
MSMNIKKGDTVVRLSGDGGKDKDLSTHQGKVIATLPKEDKVVVEGMNLVTCHIKPRRQGEEGGIVKREAAIAACKVQVVCPKCGKPTRVAHKVEKRTVAGKEKNVSVRICKKCGAEL